MLREDIYSPESAILIVMNSSLSTEVVRDGAKMCGVTDVVPTASISRAVELIKERCNNVRARQFDLVVASETIRTRFDGLETLKRIKTKYGRGGELGVVLVTNENDECDRIFYERLDIDGRIRLPSNIKQVTDVFKRILNIKTIYKPVYKALASGWLDKAKHRVSGILNNSPEHMKESYKLYGMKLKVDICTYLKRYKEAFDVAKTAYFTKNESWSYIAMMKLSVKLTPAEESYQLIRQMVKHQFGWYEGSLMLADMMIEKEDYKAALRILLRTQEVKGINIELTLMVAEIARLVENYREYINAYKRLVNDTRDSCYFNPEYYFDLSMALLSHPEEAHENINVAINLSQSYYVEYIKSLNSNPSRYVDKLYQARSSFVQNKQEVVLALAKKIIKDKEHIANEISAERIYNWSQVMRDVGLHEDAMGMAQLATAELKEDDRHAKLKSNSFDKTRREITKSQTPICPDEANRRAIELFRKGQIEIAIDMLIAAAQKSPENTNVAINLLCAVTSPRYQSDYATKYQHIIMDCLQVLSSAKLNERQQQRFEHAKSNLPVAS